jgi:hypothetical protein
LTNSSSCNIRLPPEPTRKKKQPDTEHCHHDQDPVLVFYWEGVDLLFEGGVRGLI